MTLEELNTICMQMISYAGEGRSIVYDAMSELLNNKYEEADKKLCEAEKIDYFSRSAPLIHSLSTISKYSIYG